MRVAELQDLPTVAESGVPGFEVVWWVGFFVAAASPRDAIMAINAESNRILRLADTKEKFGAHGMEPGGGTPEELGAFLKQEIAKWRKVVQEAKIRAE